MISRRRRGYGLLEALVVLALLSLFLAGAVGVGGKAVQRARAQAAARLAASEFRRLRSEAVASGRFQGMRFERALTGEWSITFLEDGDGDGILAADVARGTDIVRSGPHGLAERWGLQPGYSRRLESLRSPPPSGDRLEHLEDPVRFGRTDLASCSPRGTITPGTIYLSDGLERQFAVVVAGASARVRVWEYDIDRAEWILR